MAVIRIPAAAAIALLLLAPGLASAHNMTVVAEVRPEQLDRVQVRAFFDDSSPAPDAVVKVRDATGKGIETGKLDAKGEWTFVRPAPGSYTIRVEFVGHDREVVLVLPDDHASGQFSSPRPNILIGLAVGLTVLLGVCVWFMRRR